MTPGSVVYYQNFKFPDGGQADKLLVVLNDGNNKPFLVLKTTSRERPSRFKDPGCHSNRGYFFFPASWGGFDIDTWVLLYDQYPLSSEQFLASISDGQAKIIFQLGHQHLRAIINCLKKTDDVPAAYLELL